MTGLELDLGGFQAGLQEVEVGVNAGLGALLLRCEADRPRSFLLAGRGELGVDGVELNVGGGGIESHLLSARP